jgi:hypothetical protein
VTAPPWWRGLGPAEVVLECSGEPHTVRWERGRVVAFAHRDVEGEQALAALAGERPACLDLLSLWSRHEEDPRVLVVASRGAGDVLVAAADRPGHGWVAYAPMQSAASVRSRLHGGGGMRLRQRRPSSPRPPRWRTDPEIDSLDTLAALAGPLLDRLAGSVAAVWAERIGAGDERVGACRPSLDAALYGRAVLAARLWTADPAAQVTVRVLDPDDPPAIEREGDTLALSLPFSWVARVWATGLAVVLGRFVLGATTDDEGRLVLDTVSADLSTRAAITVGLPAGAEGPSRR